jgi:hypothetical protein
VRVYVVESVTPKDFFMRRREGVIVDELVRLLGGRTFYRIVMTSSLLDKAIQRASTKRCDVFHVSCHGNASGIQLTDKTDIC